MTDTLRMPKGSPQVCGTKPVAAPMVAYSSTRQHRRRDLERQEATTAAKAAGYHVAGIYREGIRRTRRPA